MAESDQFVPIWASAPGETVADLLLEKNLPIRNLGQLLGIAPTEANALLTGDTQITESLAKRLAECLGASESFWRNRELQYHLDQARLLENEHEWLRNLPTGDMVTFGWIKTASNLDEKIAACKQFFGVSNTPEWNAKYASLLGATAFRASSAFEPEMSSVATWLRRGEIEALSIPCQPWNPVAFEHSLGTIRGLTRQKDPTVFLPDLRSICADAGVAVVIVRSPQKCAASGATWFNSLDNAVLQLSFRFLTDDHFWFTFFHEAGHLLLHGENLSPRSPSSANPRWILEDVGTSNAEVDEQEANDFAYRTLIPEETEHVLMNLAPSHRDIVRYARQIGVSPGIVVGQLQHHGLIRRNQLNQLKRRFRWSSQTSINQRTS